MLAAAIQEYGGHPVDDSPLAHVRPSHHENVNFYGSHAIDVDGVLAQLETSGYRPLRAVAESIPSAQ